MSKVLYCVAGEASGDAHGAALLERIRRRAPEVKLLGRGGPLMRAQSGGEIRDWIEEAAVLGLWEVVKRYGFFRQQFEQTLAEIAASQADAVVLIDYPGFNLRLASALRRNRSTPKIIYYISPQVWAWNRGRIRQMARNLDLMLCIFPFEPELYQASGLRSIFVGHPLAEEMRGTNSARNKNLVALLPGSREREVRKIFPVMRDAARLLQTTHPHVRFEIAAASPRLAAVAAEFLPQGDPNFQVSVGQTRALLRTAWAGMIASGTATLEATLARLPFILVYRVNWLTYFAARVVVRVKHLGMPNVMAGREIVPEFIQHRARPRALATAMAGLFDGSARRRMLDDFDSIAGKISSGEAAGNASDAILEELAR